MEFEQAVRTTDHFNKISFTIIGTGISNNHGISRKWSPNF